MGSSSAWQFQFPGQISYKCKIHFDSMTYPLPISGCAKFFLSFSSRYYYLRYNDNILKFIIILWVPPGALLFNGRSCIMRYALLPETSWRRRCFIATKLRDARQYRVNGKDCCVLGCYEKNKIEFCLFVAEIVPEI